MKIELGIIMIVIAGNMISAYALETNIPLAPETGNKFEDQENCLWQTEVNVSQCLEQRGFNASETFGVPVN